MSAGSAERLTGMCADPNQKAQSMLSALAFALALLPFTLALLPSLAFASLMALQFAAAIAVRVMPIYAGGPGSGRAQLRGMTSGGSCVHTSETMISAIAFCALMQSGKKSAPVIPVARPPAHQLSHARSDLEQGPIVIDASPWPVFETPVVPSHPGRVVATRRASDVEKSTPVIPARHDLAPKQE